MQQSDPILPSCESPLPERLLLRLAGLPELFTRPLPRDSKVVRSATRRMAGLAGRRAGVAQP